MATTTTAHKRTIAVVGCAHGCLDEIYSTVQYIQDNHARPIDLLIVCGDMQTLRNEQDQDCLACPPKYRQRGVFHEYYRGIKVAPVLTLFVGGNHEASNYLQELRYGGFVAPNIYYMGTAGVVNLGGMRIGGISGIYKPAHFHWPHVETYPYDPSSLRSVYHVRQLEHYQLSCVSEPLDIMVSHDWPRGIEKYGNLAELLRRKPFFRDEIQSNTLGNPTTESLMHHLQPRYWFAGHLHVKFPAVVPHHRTPGSKPTETKFLALDKCVPGKEFLQVLDINVEQRPMRDNHEPTIELDPEWLAILRATHQLSDPRTDPSQFPPDGTRWPTKEEDLEWIQKRLKQAHQSIFRFHKTVRGFDEPGILEMTRRGNPQTDQLLDLLQLPHQLTVPYDGPLADYSGPIQNSNSQQMNSVPTDNDPNAIDLDDDEEDIVQAPSSSSLIA